MSSLPFCLWHSYDSWYALSFWSGGCFVESVKNAQWSMSPQEAGDGLESMVEFQVQIKGHNQREYEDKWQGWQNWTNEKLATKLTKNDQQPVLLLPARWWPDTLPEFESGGWWQRPHKRVSCRQCKCSLVENPSFKSSKCHQHLKNQPRRGQLHSIHPYTKDILKTRVWEANED